MYKTIVVGTDFSDSAGRAVEEATALAKACGATLHVVTSYKPATTAGLAASSLEVMAYGGVEFLQEAEGKLSAEIDARLGRLSNELSAEGVTVKTAAVPAADPADALIDIAEKVRSDLVVVGNRGMSGVKRFVLGSVSNKVAHHAPCSVLIAHTT